MANLRIMSIFGTRPEASKMAPLVKEIERREGVENIVCVTGQHREMLDQILNQFNITPNYDLNIMKQQQTLVDIATSAMLGLDEVMKKENPDLVLVHGDTSTTFIGGITAFYNKIKVGHVEAGLRTYNKYDPYPEEMNRVLTGHIADIHFAPTETSKGNLIRENITENIYVTGNTAIDCTLDTVKENYVFENDYLNGLDYSKKIIAMTAHRRENVGEPLENICQAMLEVVDKDEELELVYLVHFNPLVKETAKKFLGGHKRIHLLDPISLSDMHNLIARSYILATDSGGLQEEAPALNKPVVVLRNTTERPEGLEAGTLKLAGNKKQEIIDILNTVIYNREVYDSMAKAKNPYGEGNASKLIVDAILDYFSKN